MELQGRVITELEKKEGQAVSSPARNYAISITWLIFVVLCAFFVVHRQNPPAAQPAGAPPAEFASGRALEHLKVIASKPHPVGTAEHAEVQSYILKGLTNLGIKAEVQRSSVLSRRGEESYVAASVQNIIGKLEGIGGGQAILLACHYDSVPTGPGASDDGASVAALLEVIRALKTSPPLKNDLIFLFTDGEEIGMLGAKAFIDEHSAAKGIAVAMNFEARGVGGPSIMFETSEGNAWLIKELTAAAAHPVANSLTYSLYKLLGNDTDLTVFKSAGMRGLNFAYIGGIPSYHTARDSYQNIDERSLQHQGASALALARHFGNVSDWPAPAGNAVYFDLFSSALISYSERLVLPLFVLGLALFILLVVFGLRLKRLTFRGVGFGAFGFFLNLIGVGVLTIGAWQMVQRASSNPRGTDYNGGFFAIGFLLLTVAITGALLRWFRKRTSVENLIGGAMLWWVALTTLVCLRLPGGSYLFVWPLLLTVLALGTVFALREEITSTKSILILALPALSGVILFAPLMRLMIMGFGVRTIWLLMTLAVFPLALHLAHLNLLVAIRKQIFAVASGVLGLCFIGSAILGSGVNLNQPKLDHLFYTLNADAGKAIWGSFDTEPDEWTSQFFPSGAERANLADYYPWAEGSFLKHDAAVLPLTPPSIVALDDRRIDDLRVLRLRVTSPRQAPGIAIYWKQGLKLEAMAVDGKRFAKERFEPAGDPGSYRRFSYTGLPKDGIELSLEIRSADSVDLKIEDWSYAIPDIPRGSYTSRPDHIIAAPILYSDRTVVIKSYTF
jgi:hypothetical protein